jgi:hypothetical protein
MTADTEEVLYDLVHRCEALQLGGQFESAHLALPLPGRLMRDLGSVVRILVCDVTHRRHHRSPGGQVARQLVRHELSWCAALALQQLAEEPDGSAPVASRLHKDVDDVPVFVDGPPQVLLPALNPHEELIEIPRVTLAATATPQPSSVIDPEGQAPLSDRLVSDRDAALGEEVFDVAKTEAESVLQPDGVADDLGRKSYLR